jgi:hypothetical protein
LAPNIYRLKPTTRPNLELTGSPQAHPKTPVWESTQQLTLRLKQLRKVKENMTYLTQRILQKPIRRWQLLRLALISSMLIAIHAAPADAQQPWSTPDPSGNIHSTNTGNVGIGTASPTSLLHVEKNQPAATGIKFINTNAAGFSAIYFNGGLAETNGGFVQWNNTTGYKNLFVGTAENVPLYLGTNNEPRMTISPSSGYVGIGTYPNAPTQKLAVGNINAKYQDVAEWVPASQGLSPGTVVTLDPTRSNHVEASSKAYDTRVAGVISEQPGITLGERGDNKVLVATTGRVKLKVDASSGPIQVGDLLVTSDIPGVAMKSQPVDLGGIQLHRPGTLVGKALEPLAKGRGEILVLLSLQ